MPLNPENLVWLDLEMTGLDPDRDRILEIATLVTDKYLNILAEGPVLAVHQSDATLAAMGEWCTHQHGQSGLTQRVCDSRVNEADAQGQTLAFLSHYLAPNTSPMCGNSICQDRRFLYRYMPELERFFHYRNLDVSTLKELAKRWLPSMPAFTKEATHLALQDIRDSVAELRHYRQHLLRADLPTGSI
ncbi:MAG TPA: oligoribonuclease [Gammaproteobacteria bacterium]|nr:oligoribonuclease [Gammaproteobacteria bacterium]